MLINKRPFIIVITGLPCTGKTTFGLSLAHELRLPFINKDQIKEILFDALGWNNREWSKQLGQVSYNIMFFYAETLLGAGTPLILESNFDRNLHSQKLQNIIERTSSKAVQLQLVADGNVLIQRFRQRWDNGKRHPGHVDCDTIDELKDKLLLGRGDPLDIQGKYLEIDTTCTTHVDLSSTRTIISEIIST